MKTRPRFRRLLAGAATLLILGLSVAFAAPPGGGGGGSTSQGKILFQTLDGTYSMNSDGSGKQFVSGVRTDPSAVPPYGRVSARTYNGSRWHLLVEELPDQPIRIIDGSTGEEGPSIPAKELFAYRWIGAGFEAMQLTDLSRDGLYYQGGVAWSNDGQDSFVSIRMTGYDLDEQGRYIVTDSRPQYVLRISISGAEMEVCADAGVDPMVRASDSDTEIVASDLNATIHNYTRIFSSHSWSPDGQFLTITEQQDPIAPGCELNVWHAATRTKVVGRLYYSPDDSFPHQWSSDGGKIVLGDNNSITVINSDGSGAPTILRPYSTRSGSYYHPYWSPDGRWVVYRHFAATRSIRKYPLAGGKEVNLTKDLNGIQQWPLGWTAN
ncbi:MAG: TolB family protein [Pirellulaceae bacterium]